MAYESFVQVGPDGAGKRLHTRANTIGGTLLQDEVFEIAHVVDGSVFDPVAEGGTVAIKSGTIQTLNGGTLQYLGNVGTLPSIVVGSGTLQMLNGGTLQYLGNVGTLPNVVIGSGTLQYLNGGSLQYVGSIGTLPNVVVGSGTLQVLNGLLAGTLNYLNNVGTVFYQNNLGTLFYVESLKQIGTLPNIVIGSGTLQTLNSGSLQYIGNIGTLPPVIIASGTIQSVSSPLASSVWDVSDRAGRIVGITYGNLAQLQQKAATFELLTEDTGLHTNPEKYLHDQHWDTQTEVDVDLAAADHNLGAAVAAGKKRRIRSLIIRHAGTNNTVVSLRLAAGRVELSLDIPAQTTRIWSDPDGFSFAATEQPAVQSSDVTGGHTFINASGIEA